MNKCVAVLFVLAVVVTGCSGEGAASTPPRAVADSALDGLLLDTAEVNTVMGTDSMQTHPVATVMGDHRNLLPNLNCLGVWQVNEAPIYDPSYWKSVRQQMLRTPDTDQWDSLVVQSVVSYRTPDGPQLFLADSADRWSKCSNHNVNIRLNDQKLPAWKSGALTRTDSSLAMPYSRGVGDQMRSCQHVLQAAANIIIDVAACGPQTATFTKGAEIANRIEAKMPR